jgi:hypothetical protein
MLFQALSSFAETSLIFCCYCCIIERGTGREAYELENLIILLGRKFDLPPGNQAVI